MSEIFGSAPIMDSHILHIFSLQNLMPNAPVVQSKPEVFHPERDTEMREMFDTPTPLGNRASQIVPVNQMELLFVFGGPPEEREDERSELVQNGGRDRIKSTPVYRQARKYRTYQN